MKLEHDRSHGLKAQQGLQLPLQLWTKLSPEDLVPPRATLPGTHNSTPTETVVRTNANYKLFTDGEPQDQHKLRCFAASRLQSNLWGFFRQPIGILLRASGPASATPDYCSARSRYSFRQPWEPDAREHSLACA